MPSCQAVGPAEPWLVPGSLHPTITGDLKSKIDRIWDAFWSGGISTPLEVIEQITYLLFIKRLDDLQINTEERSTFTKVPIERAVLPAGKDAQGRPYDELRWSRFKDAAPTAMFEVIAERAFPFLCTLGGHGSTYSQHMKDARSTIPTPGLLAKAVDMLGDINMDGRDTKGDLDEYMLAKIASVGANGQFRTPRHIINLMVEMTAPTPRDEICDPACGTAGFLVEAGSTCVAPIPRRCMTPRRESTSTATCFTATTSTTPCCGSAA